MKSLRTRAVVLRRTNYGEADRILQLLTPDGRVSAIARGVRREKSKLAGGIELFAISDVVVGEGKGELGILTSARLVQFYRHIMDDYDRMQFAYLVLGSVARASQSLDQPEWYEIVTQVLMGLDSKTLARELVETWFYVRYAAMLGDELNVLRDVGGEKLTLEVRYRYDDNEKGFVEHPNGEVSAEHIKVLRLVGVKPLSTLAQIGGLEPVLAVCAQVARQHAAVN